MIGLQYLNGFISTGHRLCSMASNHGSGQHLFSAANLSLTDVPEDTPYLQYRVKYKSPHGMSLRQPYSM